MGIKKSKGCCLSTTAKFVILTVITATLICVVVVLAITVSSKDKKYNEMERKYKAGANLSNICLTHTCIETANRVNQYMDTSASPCENFYQYACGGWEKRNPIPFYMPYTWSVTEEMSYDVLQFFREKLEEPIGSSSFEPDIKARTLYLTCIKTDNLEATGLSEVRQIIDNMGGLSFNISVPFPDFDLTERLIELSTYKIYPLFTVAVDFHRYITRTALLQLAPAAEPLLFSRNDSLPIWLLVAEELGKPWNDLYEGETPPSADVFLETYLIISDLKDALDSVKGFSYTWNDTVLSVAELNALCPKINWTKIIKVILKDGKVPGLITVSNKSYFEALNLLLDRWNPRALDNFLKFSLVLNNLMYFPYEYRKVMDNLLNRVVFEKPSWHRPPRWQFCVNQIKVHMPLVMSRWYIEDYVESEDAIVEDVDGMIEDIRSTYIDVLKTTKLLDKETSNFAIRKIKAMEKQVVYPQYTKNLTIIEELYTGTVANGSSSFFMNVMNSAKATPYDAYLAGVLTEEQWDSLWLDHVFVINGFYAATMNRFTILAGILQGAFYNLENPKYMNYGSMGFTIGHEFTHGFDDTGRHFGVNGLVNSWWTTQSEDNYMKVKICYQKQYSSIKLQAYDTNDTYTSNGNMTLDENIADNGSEFVVFQAYEKWVEEHGEEKLLPTPYLDTWQKQYYVAQAQGWCAKYTSTGLNILLGTYVHSQKEVRVNGMYQNSVRFSEIFQCPAGTYMNPTDKCKLWQN